MDKKEKPFRSVELWKGYVFDISKVEEMMKLTTKKLAQQLF